MTDGSDRDPVLKFRELILFRLRIHFADFLAYIVPSTAGRFTLETACGYEYDRAWEALGPPDFQGPPGAHRAPRDAAVLFQITDLYLLPSCFCGGQSVKQKR
ncbi:hypothetical protein LOK49_LG13G00035 [Camellia lanceoleosa]|uniref:Uncharacterized protein n=1 Tax=Camellia lanceoleosa TaxID=1840588 RepID=A0ACC0FJJ0_9ERIC|nr:hypothetical protein LOK49_LG13G00035 [Camellia lanceoleosa]